MNPHKRSIIISSIATLLLIGNYSRMRGTENIRSIHMVTLITLGVAIGVLLVNIIMLIKNKKS